MSNEPTTPITQTLTNTMLVWYIRKAREKGYKNAQALIDEVLREYKEKTQTPAEKVIYKPTPEQE